MALIPVKTLTKRLHKPLRDLVLGQRLSWGEVLHLVKSYLEVHYPEGQEKYVSGGSPIFFYGQGQWESFKVKGKKTKVKPMGDVMLDLEKVLLPLAYDHDLQWYEIYSLIYLVLRQTLPQGEEHFRGTKAVFYYGPKESLNKTKRGKKRV